MDNKMFNNFDIKTIKAIVGLGNPGRQYVHSRHNIGFRIVDALCLKFGESFKDGGDLETVTISLVSSGQKIMLIKPMRYMNNSGCVINFLQKKGISIEEILVIHDELEKTFGVLSFKFGGSARGHNGLKSIIGMGGDSFWRLRFGIGRPADKAQVSDYVLSPFSLDEETKIADLITQAITMLNID